MEDVDLSEESRRSGLNSQHGAARGRRPTNTGLRHNSSNSILDEASLPVASRCNRTPLISILWYPAVGAARQLGPKGPKRTELYLVMSA